MLLNTYHNYNSLSFPILGSQNIEIIKKVVLLKNQQILIQNWQKFQIHGTILNDTNWMFINFDQLQNSIWNVAQQWFSYTLLKFSDKNLENWRFHNKNSKNNYNWFLLKLRSWPYGYVNWRIFFQFLTTLPVWFDTFDDWTFKYNA